MSTQPNIPNKCEQEAELSADLESIWQEESPTTARVTKTADEVDGELETRNGA